MQDQENDGPNRTAGKYKTKSFYTQLRKYYVIRQQIHTKQCVAMPKNR